MAHGGRAIDGLLDDLAAALRQLRRRPGFTVLAVGTLSLGLTATTAVVTYVDAYSAAIPGVGARGVQQIWFASEGEPWGTLSWPDLLDLRDGSEGSFRVLGYRPGFLASVRHEELTEVVPGEAVTGDLFDALEIPMALGRGLTEADDEPSAEPVTVISNAYWALRYGSAPDVLGRTLFLNGRPHTIVGVAAPSFLGLSSARRPGFWLPFSQFIPVYWARSDNETNREVASVQAYARPAPGQTVASARERLTALATALDDEAPLAERTRRFTMTPATWIHPASRDAEAATTRIMLLAASVLLLLACANVANLVLSMGARRQQEVAVRSALGASGGRLARQLVAENALLSIGACALALVLAEPMANRLSEYFARPSVWGTNVPRLIELDPRVVLVAAVVALLAGVVTSLVPAVRLFGRDLASVLRGSAGSIAGPARSGIARHLGLQEALVALQLALSVVLIFVASLVVRTLDAAGAVDVGFPTRGTLASYVSTSSMGVATEDRHAFFGGLVERLEGLDWIDGATVSENAPLSPHPTLGLTADAAGEALPVVSSIARVWPGYLELMDADVRSGRMFERTDSAGAPDVVIVNEALARALFGTLDAVGATLYTPDADGRPERPYDVVGVVRDAHITSVLDAVEPVAYFSLLQHYSAPGNGLVVRVREAGVPSVDRLERALRDVDPRIAIVNILPYGEVVDGFLYVHRMNAEMFTLIALLGLVLAAAGLFSVVALSVARRRREIGVRIAIGAARPAVVRLVLGGVAVPLVVGTLVGIGACWLAAAPLRGLLWNTSVADPVALGSGALTVAAAVVLAVVVPVRRALRVDPASSLRSE
jgi:predicted permease